MNIVLTNDQRAGLKEIYPALSYRQAVMTVIGEKLKAAGRETKEGDMSISQSEYDFLHVLSTSKEPCVPSMKLLAEWFGMSHTGAYKVVLRLQDLGAVTKMANSSYRIINQDRVKEMLTWTVRGHEKAKSS